MGAAFGMKIAQHMNDDHMSATMAIVEAQIPGLDVTEAVIISVDSLGMYVKVSRQPRASDQPQQFKIRVPFPRQAKDRKDVKTFFCNKLCDEMLKTSVSLLLSVNSYFFPIG